MACDGVLDGCPTYTLATESAAAVSPVFPMCVVQLRLPHMVLQVRMRKLQHMLLLYCHSRTPGSQAVLERHVRRVVLVSLYSGLDVEAD